MTRIRLEELTKRYGPVTALHELSLTVEPGEFLAIVGHSGSGKSTLLRLIAGLESPTAGEIFFNSERVTRLPPHARDVGMVFQSYALYPHMSVFDNLAFPLRVRRWKREAITERVRQVAQLLGLEELLHRYPRELSGGQRQRVALGRALVRSPRVFLFDEPLSNIDAQLRATMRAELAALQRELGITAIYVTHDQSEALSLGHRVAVLARGRLLHVAPPAELYNYPASVEVARFIGNPPMNLFAVVVGEGRLRLRDSTAELPCPLPLPPDTVWLLGIRAETLGVATADGWHWLGNAQVEATEYVGHELLVALKHPAAVVSPVFLRLPGTAAAPPPGSTLPLFAAPQPWCLFAPDSGARVYPP